MRDLRCIIVERTYRTNDGFKVHKVKNSPEYIILGFIEKTSYFDGVKSWHTNAILLDPKDGSVTEEYINNIKITLS